MEPDNFEEKIGFIICNLSNASISMKEYQIRSIIHQLH